MKRRFGPLTAVPALALASVFCVVVAACHEHKPRAVDDCGDTCVEVEELDAAVVDADSGDA